MTLTHEYIAGFFDGEGCAGLYWNTSTKYWEPHIQIRLRWDNPNRSMLTRLSLQYRSSVFQSLNGYRKDGSRKYACTLRIYTRDEILRFIDDILPYVCLKKTQLVLLQAYLLERTYGKHFAMHLKQHKRRY